jgi:hypothetical protein
MSMRSGSQLAVPMTFTLHSLQEASNTSSTPVPSIAEQESSRSPCAAVTPVERGQIDQLTHFATNEIRHVAIVHLGWPFSWATQVAFGAIQSNSDRNSNPFSVATIVVGTLRRDEPTTRHTCTIPESKGC